MTYLCTYPACVPLGCVDCNEAVPDHRYVDDRDERFDDDPECERCRGDGMDPWCDYLMPCPACQGEQRP